MKTGVFLSVIGNSLKSIYSRITSIQPAIDALAEIGVNVKDSSGEMIRVEDILTSLSGKWKNLSAEQQQNLGLQIAGRYQLSRFLILMDQFGESQASAEAAINSQGSAYRENEKYLKTYEARLNNLQNKWTETVIAMQNSGLGVGMLATIEGGASLVGNIAKLIDSFGILPSILGLSTAAFMVFNKTIRTGTLVNGELLLRTLRGLPVGFRTLESSMAGATLMTRVYSGAMTTATVVARGLQTALIGTMKFLAGAVLPVAGFMALGWAITSVTQKIVEQKEALKEREKEIQDLTKSYSNNETQILSLVSKYEQLQEQVSNGNLAENDKEYLAVQNELYTLLPSVAEKVDEKGQAHLKSADAIRQELGYLNDLAKVDAEKFIADFHSSLEDLNDQIDETQKKLSEIQSRQENGYSDLIPFFGIRENAQLEDVASSIINQRDMEAAIEQRKRMFTDLGQSYATYYGLQNQLTEEDRKYIDTIVDKNSKLLETSSGITEVENKVKSYIGAVGEIRTVTGDVFSTDEIERFISTNKEGVQLFHEMSNAIKNGNTDWDSYRSRLQDAGIRGKTLEIVIDNLKNGQYGLTSAVDEGTVYFDEYGNEIEDVASDVDKLVEAFDNATSNIKSLNGVLNDLSESHELSADSISFLMEKYPDLLQYLGNEAALIDAVKAKIAEEESVAKQAIANKLMYNETFFKQALKGNSAYFKQLSDHYKVDLSNAKSLAQAKAMVEEQLINNLAKGWNNYYQQTANGLLKLKQANGVADNITRAAMAGGKIGGRDANEIIREMSSYNNELTSLANAFNKIAIGGVNVGTNFSNIGLKTPSSSGSKGSSSKDKTEDAQKKVLEVIEAQINAYKRRADLLNDNIALEEYYLAKYESTDAQYRQRQKNIVKLKKQQAEYHLQTIKYIEGQIKSNKKLNSEQRKELEDTLVSTRETYYSTLSTIDSLNKEIKQSYEEIADEVIDTYKEMIETQRDLALKALDDELNQFEKTHQRKIKLLDEELSSYEKIINKQKEALNNQKDEEDWNKKLSERQKDLQDLQNDYNVWSKDDSASGKKRASDLAKEIESLQDEINEMLRDRQYNLEQSALDKLLEDKKTQIEAEKELENANYDTEKDNYDKQRTDLERHYENLLNDERAFAEMRNQILAGQVNSINAQLKVFSSTVSKNMKDIGESISENLIDKIKEAQSLLGGLSGGVSKGGSSSNLVDLINQLKKNGFDKGGFVGHDGLTYVHGGERVLDKEDNRNFEMTMKFLDKAKSWITPMIKQPSIPTLVGTGAGTRPISISMPITIENMNGTQQDANNVFSQINQKLTQSGIIRKLT